MFGGQWKVLVFGGQWKVRMLSGQWKVPSLMANERFQAWWPMEGSKFNGQWKVPSLVANERFQAWWPMKRFNIWWPLEGERKTSFSLLLIPPPPNKYYLNPFFPIDLKVLFSHGSRPLFYTFPLFSLAINYNHASQCTKSSTHSSLSWFWSKIFFVPWIHGVVHDHVLWPSSRTNEWRTASKVIPKFDIDATSLWWRFWTTKNAPSSWSWTPLSLVLLHLS